MCFDDGTSRRVTKSRFYSLFFSKSQIRFLSCSDELEDEGDSRAKSKANIIESLSEDGNYVTNISNIVAGRVGNIFGKGIGGLSTKFGGGTSSWF